MSSSSLPKTYKAAVVVAAGKFELRDVPMPTVSHDKVLVKVEACGVCHSDHFTVDAIFPIQFPRAPGHEVIGVVVAAGSECKRFKVGDRVGRGWFGGCCFECDDCRNGDFIHCSTMGISGITDDGGYQQYMLAPEHSLAKVPTNLTAEDAAPLMCAGVTVFNGMRQLKVMPPAVVVIQGIGGLGHLAIQFARKMGYHVVALSRGQDKKKLALDLGAHVYIDAATQNAVEEINKLGGASIILTTTGAKAVSPLVEALTSNGTILAVGAEMDNFAISSVQLLGKSKSIKGHPSGTAYDIEQTLKFASLADVHSQTEVYPFEKFQEAYDRMMKGHPKFRVVLKFNSP